MIRQQDLNAIQKIVSLLKSRFAKTTRELNRNLIYKQIIKFIDLAIKLNKGVING